NHKMASQKKFGYMSRKRRSDLRVRLSKGLEKRTLKRSSLSSPSQSSASSTSPATPAKPLKVSFDFTDLFTTRPIEETTDKFSNREQKLEQFPATAPSYRLVDINNLVSFLCSILICSSCNGKVKMVDKPQGGLAMCLEVFCLQCGSLGSHRNSKRHTFVDDSGSGGGKWRPFESINVAAVLAGRLAGLGEEKMKRMAAVFGLKMPSNWTFLQSVLHAAFKSRAQHSMARAVRLEKSLLSEPAEGAAASYDGSWQKRGHKSLTGFVSVLSLLSNMVLGVDVRHKYCPVCKRKSRDEGVCPLGDHCQINHTGSSVSMESAGAVAVTLDLYQRFRLRITQYLGDGHTSAFANTKAAVGWQMNKLECVNHLAARFTKSLTDAVAKAKVVDDTVDGSRGLNKQAIEKLRFYYRFVLTEYADDVWKMRNRVKAIWKHVGSSDEKPNHRNCDPKHCKFKQAMKAGQQYLHSEHFHIEQNVMEKVKNEFMQMADIDLLRRTLHGQTTNANESFNSTVWNLLPKAGYANRQLVELAVFIAVCQYNEGMLPLFDVLTALGFDVPKELKGVRPEERKKPDHKAENDSETEDEAEVDVEAEVVPTSSKRQRTNERSTNDNGQVLQVARSKRKLPKGSHPFLPKMKLFFAPTSQVTPYRPTYRSQGAVAFQVTFFPNWKHLMGV
ncbi:hypothetical protein TYRP_017228, partial [Tyrophagus putrescentiae]